MLLKTGGQKSSLNCILLIDDDKLTNFMNKIVVDAAWYPEHVVRRESANSALEYILDSSVPNDTKPFPNLIFVDINMPHVDGWQFLESLEKLKSSMPLFPVIIMLSSFVTPAAILKASDFPDLSGIFSKPMSDEVYDAIIAEYFIPASIN